LHNGSDSIITANPKHSPWSVHFAPGSKFFMIEWMTPIATPIATAIA
jgi:hypothetical protein